MRESTIERKVCEYARTQGWMALKFVSPGMIGVPDRIFLRNGETIFVEFKRPGENPTKIQSALHYRLIKQGFKAYVCSSVEDGKNILIRYEL